MTKPKRCLALWTIFAAASPALLAQPSRIAARIDNDQSVVLVGRVHRQATAKNDAGPVENSFPLSAMTLTLKPSAAQLADLNQLLLAQQDSASPNYRQWLTPEQYADRFGVSAGDLTRITAWLESQGFSVDYVARGRNYVTFSGTAQQAGNSFHTQIHRYNVNGETHYANATVPSVPAALAGLVSGVRGLDNFRLKPRVKKVQPQVILSRQTLVGPTDFAAIYDVKPLYTEAVNGTLINGAGQKIAIVGQSQILTSDITRFRSAFGLGAANLTQVRVPGGGNPGFSPYGDWTESDLDIEWSGAVAPNATIVFVYSNDVWTSAQYAIDQGLALAPVLSMSYGACEEGDVTVLDTYRGYAQQAVAEGITMLSASGDNAAADCDTLFDNFSPAVAEGGLAADAPASIPEVTGMGGTQFNEGTGNYWTNGAANGYIPEVVWNSTVLEQTLAGSGGGASVHFSQPPWQIGIAPNDGMRHVPDLALASSDYHDPFYMYTSDTSFGPAGAIGIGGTSCAAPSMAGIVALINQYMVASGAIKQPGLGNINPTLYALAKTQSNAFHDIVNGSNIVPCADSPDCLNGSMGWPALPGYDSATGLGSVDAYNLVNAWNTALATQAVVVPSLDQNPVYETSTNQWTFTLTLNEEGGIAATLTGLTINGTSLSPSQIFSTTAIPANGSISASYSLRNLTVPVNVVFGFSFAGANGATWNTSLTVPFQGPQPVLTIDKTVNNQINTAACQGVGSNASGQAAFAPGMIISVYGTGMGNYAEAASVTPLPEYMAGFEATVSDQFGNGAYVPLFYVSPNQVNMQVPYEIQPGTATLWVGNPYAAMQCTFTVASAAPGIYSYADTSANRSPIGSGAARVGDTVAIYVTGVGHVSIDPNDGDLPLLNSNPAPTLPVSITVGGVAVAQPFAYIGLPNWSVGVAQINFTIPSGVATGPQPVVVTVGSAPSLPANIAIAQ
jgi:uncharacterized protein (TIGR03437 family)